MWKYETGSVVRSSPALWGGHFCVGSYDSKIYCFSDDAGNNKQAEPENNSTAPIKAPDKIKWEVLVNKGWKLDFAVTEKTTAILTRINKHRNLLECFDNSNGKLLWSRLQNKMSSLSKIISWKENLIFQINDENADNEIICVDPETNQKLWGILSSNIFSERREITLIGNTLFFLKEGDVVAINPSNGKELSEFENFPNQFPVAVSENKVVYFENKTFRIFDRESMIELPSIKSEIFKESRPWYPFYSSPAPSIVMSGLSGNRLIFLTKRWWWSKNSLFVFDLETGECLLKKISTFNVDFGDKYLATTTPGNPYSFSSWDMKTGQNNWVKDGKYKKVFSPIFLKDGEVVACNSRELKSFNLETGKENWSVFLPYHPQFFTDNKIGIKFLKDGSVILLSSQHLSRISPSN